MGNNQNYQKIENPYGHIFIGTEKAFYNPGSVVSGNIYLNFTTPFKAITLFLQIEGSETSSFKTRHPKGDTFYLVDRKGSFVFFRQKIPVHIFENPTLQGQMQFPFQFKLPEDITGSVSLQGRDDNIDYLGDISYKMTALFDGEQDLSFSQKLIVRENVWNVQSNTADLSNKNDYETAGYANKVHQQKEIEYGKQINFEPLTCFCLSQGNSRINLVNLMPNYVQGNYINFQIEVDNSQCKCEETQLRSDKGKQMNIKTQKLSMSFEDTPKLGKQVLNCSFLLTAQQDSFEMNIPPSVAGMIVKNQYYIEIQADYEGFMINDIFPGDRIPLAVLAQENTEMLSFPIPQESWQPQIYEKENLEFKEEYNLEGAGPPL